MKNVKCYIINNDISIFEYELLENMKTFQVEIISKTNKRYILGNFSTLKKAKDYIKSICK